MSFITNRGKKQDFWGFIPERTFYAEYGKVYIVKLKKAVLLLDLVLPLFWLIALLIPERYNIELKRITIKDD